MLLSSTSAYNILVYANQDSVADSLSAIESSSDAAVAEPNIAVQGGTLELNADENSTDTGSTVTWIGDGSEQNPYQISSVEHLMQVDKMVNATTVGSETGIHNAINKYFILTADIDVSSLFASGSAPYPNDAGSAYLVSADATDADSDQKYINLDGSYEVDGVTYKHKIYISDSTAIEVKNYENFALFGYLGKNSVISNVVFENINVKVSSQSAQRISIISYFNEGIIKNCEIVDSSIEISGSSVDGATSSLVTNAYFGIAGAVADNRAAVNGVKVSNLTISLSSSSNDYIGGIVGQNRGTVEDSSVSGIKIDVTNTNHYVGGLVGYNANVVESCSVDMAGSDGMTENITHGGYVGGLVGYNDTSASISNSSVTGTYTSVQSTSSSAYNMCGKADDQNSTGSSKIAYFGGITAVNAGSIKTSTVSDLGFYMNLGSVACTGYFGGIAAISTGGTINTSVSSGTFVSQNSTVCRAGGIIAYAETTDTQIVNNCYTFFKLNVPAVDLVGAIVGYGGNTQTVVESYWSDTVSGCVTAYVIPNPENTDGIQRPTIIQPFVGKLNSLNRAVTVEKGASKSVDASELEHVFDKIDAAEYEVAKLTALDSFTVVGTGTNNNIINKDYGVSVSFPTDASGVPLIGSADKQGMVVSFTLDVFVTSASGDPDNQSDPLQISSSTLAKFISSAPYGHYKLMSDIAVLSKTWKSCYFTGSIDGNGKIISTDAVIFKAVIGSRDTLPKIENAVSAPEKDTADRSHGTITELNVDLSDNIQSAVFGTVYDATIINVALTDGDPTPDDGNASSYEGYVAQITQDYNAAFINCAVGYSYIYGCSTDVSVEMGSVVNSAAFIAYVSDSVVIDNCIVNSVGAYIGTNNTTQKAVFLGHVKHNTGGYILNSVVTARVIGTGTCYLVMGENLGQYSPRYRNIIWSKMQYGSTDVDCNISSEEVTLWGSSGSNKQYSAIEKTETAGNTLTYKIAIPQNVTAFENASFEDFSISFVDITVDENKNYIETAVAEESDISFKLSDVYVENGEIGFNVVFSADAENGDSIWVKVFHYETGLLTYVRFTVITETFERGEDGYYHISSPADLIAFSEQCDANTKYLSYAYKLDKDINMEGYVYTPAASSGNPFVGRFDGMGYTIKNLTITGETNSAGANIAFIEAAASGDDIVVTNTTTGETETVASGIYNLTIEGANIVAQNAADNAAVLVALSSSSSEADYGKLNISNVEIKDSTVISNGKNTAAVVAHAVNTDLYISEIELNNVKVHTNTTSTEYINSTSYSSAGGLGGIIGTVTDSIKTPTVSHQVTVTDVTVNGLILSGGQLDETNNAFALDEANYAVAMANAGTIVGTYQKYYSNSGYSVPKLTIGDASSESEYDIVVNDLLIKSTYITGGLIGSTNAQTSVSKAKISATGENKSQIFSTTDYFIGGIAGHIGSYDADNETDANAVANMYGTISDCLVENTEIKATSEAISSPTASHSRNVAVGGIAGAINGPSTGKTVQNCTVKNSLVEGVVVGGIVGSNIERTVVSGNILHINNCDVIATTVKTPDECFPAALKYASNAVNYAGVGGILGTNVISTTSYISNVLIDYCDVDATSQIINTIPAKYTGSSGTVYAQSATGGILGSGFQLKSNGVQLSLKYNTVYSAIISKADMEVAACWNLPNTQYSNKLRVGTGGFIGMLAGYGTTILATTSVYLMTISVQESVFGGSVRGTDCIGGVIGSVVSAIGYESNSTTSAVNRPTDFIKNVVVSGELTSDLDSTYYRGGVVIGSILISSGTPSTAAGAIGCYNGQDMTQTFSGIYYSSLAIDTTVFPAFSCVGAKTTSTSIINSPTHNTTKGYLKYCYIDVNMTEGNSAYQLTDPQNTDTDSGNPKALDNIFNDVSTEFTIGGSSDISAPSATRGTIFSLEPVSELDNAQSCWKSSHPMIAAVSDNSVYTEVTVTPKSKNDNAVTISIDYLGVMTSTEDSTWIVPVSLPVGFKLYSKADKVLDYVVVDGEKYYLISDILDFNYIDTGKNYWLKNDIVFTASDFESSGTYAGGYPSKSTETAPFTGEFASMPQGTYTVYTASGEQSYTSTQEIMTISGLKLKSVTGGTYSAAALFAYADGATFKNFILSDVTSTDAVDYAASVAAVVSGSLTAENVVVENANISGAKYSGGLFGGMFNGDVTIETPWQITNCSVIGTCSGSGENKVYSTNILALNGAAGVAVHTDQNPAIFSGLTVSGSLISQSATAVDATYFDNGAAGISLAYSGTISASQANRNTIENSHIVGEIAAGAVVRTYTSASTTAFTSAGKDAQIYSIDTLSISEVDLISSVVEGNHTSAAGKLSNYMIASGGILSRVDSSYVEHSISDCSLDASTAVKAPYGVGGILGCFEETYANTYQEIDNKAFGISINNCDIAASIEMTKGAVIEDAESNTYYFFNMGAGGVIGAFSVYSNLTKTNIKNCSVSGIISGPSAVGGVIGAIWTDYVGTAPTTFRLDNMDSHFVENCVVSATFRTADGSEAFSASNPTTGIIVGHVFSAAANNSAIFKAAADNGFSEEFSNQPFYNIYYSGYMYPEHGTYLFGVVDPSSPVSLNYYADGENNKYSCYTDYVYDMNYVYTGDNNSVISTEIDVSTHSVAFSDVYRVQKAQSEEDGIWVIDYRTLGTGLEFSLSNFIFNTSPKTGDTSAVTYQFDEDASLSRFVLSASAGSTQTSVAELVEVKATSSGVKVEKGEASGEYKLSTTSEPEKTFTFDLVFVYSNGLELAAPFRIEVSDGDYYFTENNSKGGKNYYIFNAANLNSTLQLYLSENDNVIQCFDVFWTADNSAVTDAVNAYTSDVTLAQAYSGVTFDGVDFLTLLASVQHPNPEYDSLLGNAENLNISDYLGLSANESLGDVTLSRLVKEINDISYGAYETKGDSALYEGDFAGTYTVLKAAVADKNTGLTAPGEYYSIYGLELHAVNTSAQKSDASHTGLFKSLAAGASVTGLTFVNPRIEVVGAKGEANYAGVLAGSAVGATITDVSVERYQEGDTAYISSIRRMTAASTFVGGIVGYADSATSITGCSVDGLDVVAASLAANNSTTLKTVMAGGIVGSSDALITATSVANSRILVERNDRYRNFYLSYAGGIAARATNSISDIRVTDTVMRDCTCEVIANDSNSYSTYSYTDNALVADRIGGVVAYTDGSLSIESATVSGLTVRAFDISGGIIATVENNPDADISISKSSVSTSLNEGEGIRVYSSANTASVSALRQYYSAAGGVIGKIGNLKSLDINTCNVNGYVGTYSYDNLNKDCTAGGIIGFVTDELTSLDAIKVYNSTVSGEIAGYHSSKTGSMIPYLGAAGGLIGKINTRVAKENSDSMISECVMSAEVNLYTDVSGTLANAKIADPSNAESTNVGKILGTLVASSTTTDESGNTTTYKNFALLEAENETDANFNRYFNNIYVSSYPQDIIAYGSRDFYTAQVSPYVTYTDINKVVSDEQTGETEGTLSIGDIDLSGVENPTYTDATYYSDFAVIPIDLAIGNASRGFRVRYNTLPENDESNGTGIIINFLGSASIISNADIGDASINITTNTLVDKDDGYYYGILQIDKVTKDIIGEIVMDYDYGLQVGIEFTSIDIKGKGTADDAFQISEPKHFEVMRELRDKYYIQTNDIDLSSQYSYSDDVLDPLWATEAGFEPIGTSDEPFVGSYDGQGYLIKNLYISATNTDNIGLFGYVKGTADSFASISNVHIEIAGEMSVCQNSENLKKFTVVYGNVTGKDNVGGLAGSAVNADITNCSVVKGNVIGSTAVGGLVGNASGSTINSCFTSTTTYAYYDLAGNTPSAKTAGGLVGIVSGSLEINNSFTLGFVAQDPYSNYNYGSVGGFVGYVGSGSSLVIDSAFVGAGVSNSTGLSSNGVAYRGLTVGTADSSAVVQVSNTVISAASAAGESYAGGVLTEVVNPILGSAKGATISNVIFDSGLNGNLGNRTETDAVSAEFSLDEIELGVASPTDAYTAAYVEFASLEISVSSDEIVDRGTTYQYGGLFYPITVKGEGLTITSSAVDLADKSAYPAEMDVELYGNGDSKNTDLLFKSAANGTVVYLNIYDMAIADNNRVGTYNNGTPYDNGELFYNCALPYFTVEKQSGDYELYRKVTYPVQSRIENGSRMYPIATERQLNALAGYESSGTFGSFSKSSNYALVTDITLGNYSFKPISGFTGVLNGKNHTVSNLTINRSDSNNVGFFSELTISTVKNLHIEVNTITGNTNVGGLVGYVGLNGSDPSKVIITGCSVSMSEGGNGVVGTQYVGGLAGYVECGVAENTSANIVAAGISDSNTDVTVSGSNIVGGFVGYSEMFITNCYSTGDVNATINADDDAPRGIGGLVGALFSKSITSAADTQVTNSFSSSAVDVGRVTGYNYKGNGVGGLIGNVATGTTISTVFSSGSVRYCYGDDVDINTLQSCSNTQAVGIGGLVGVLNSDTLNVYSAASVAAKVGEVDATSVVGIGGVAGIANVSIQSAYSSGSTLGMTATTGDLSGYNYGVGGVVGLVSSKANASNLYFDKNVSAVSETAVGKSNADAELSNVGFKSTKEFTFVTDKTDGGFLGGNFQFTDGAYPYLSNFFADDVSLAIRLNALLSIVAIQLNELDQKAVDGEGISMAMTIPTGITHDEVAYTYGFAADNSFGDSATSIVDKATNTLTVQRTSNAKEQANFIITIETVDGNSSTADGVVYSTVASRPLSRVCAQMLGTQEDPYLIASQTDLEHVAMSAGADGELSKVPSESHYSQWNTPIDENGNPIEGKVYYRLMGYVNLNETEEYSRSFSNLEYGYSLDGNGYSIRNLTTTLANELDASSVVTNITFENVGFDSGESLVGTLNGSAVGVNVYGSATGSNVAGIAQTVGEGGLVEGCIANLDYSSDTAQSNIAGLALTNNGTVEMSASVGNIEGTGLSNVSGLVNINNGVIKNSFTMGDIILDAPKGAVAGFVGANNGTVEACYTRCNIKVENADVSSLKIGSFAGSNGSEDNTTASVSESFAAGLFDVRKADASPASLSGIFVGSNSGTLEDVMFDKQLSGTCFKDIFTFAESTSDIATMANHAALKTAYTVATTGEGENATVKGDEYPQLSAILATANSEDEVTVRMYRTLRSYSLLSTATAMVANDNYIDNVVVGSVTPLTSGKMTWDITGNGETSGTALKANSVGDALATATLAIEDFYNVYNTGDTAKLSDTVNLYFYIDEDGANPNFAGGNGSEESPYEISTKEQVVALSYYGKNSNSFFKVVNDIDMTDTDWNAYIDIFKADLDGQGYALSNITIPAEGSNALIGSLDGGSVSNLGLAGIKVTTSALGASGLLAAKALNNASVTNCVVVGELNAPTGTHAGGLVGETDGATVIDGCIVSGKITSGATNVGGLAGLVAEGTTVSNCLSTVFVNGGENSTAGGILGGGTATVTNSVFAGNVKGNTVGNIAGDSSDITVDNCYYDKQLSMVDGGATASTTYFLTTNNEDNSFAAKEVVKADGTKESETVMAWIPGFVGYPVPATFAAQTGYSADFINAVELASAKISFATGIGAGTSTTFTTATPTAIENAVLGVSGLAGSESNNFLKVEDGIWVTDTSLMALGQVYGGELTYSIGTMTRYIDVEVGKQIKTVNYTINGLESNSKSVISAITGNGGGATAATAFDTAQQGVLCNNMVFTYDVVDGYAQLFRVETQLPNGYKVSYVSVECVNTTYNDDGSVSMSQTVVDAEEVNVIIGDDGLAYVYVPVSDGNNDLLFNTINITVETVETNSWGIRNLFGLFR